MSFFSLCSWMDYFCRLVIQKFLFQDTHLSNHENPLNYASQIMITSNQFFWQPRGLSDSRQIPEVDPIFHEYLGFIRFLVNTGGLSDFSPKQPRVIRAGPNEGAENLGPQYWGFIRFGPHTGGLSDFCHIPGVYQTFFQIQGFTWRYLGTNPGMSR